MSDLLTWHPLVPGVEVAMLGDVLVGRVAHSGPASMMHLPNEHGRSYPLWTKAKSLDAAKAEVERLTAEWIAKAGLKT